MTTSEDELVVLVDDDGNAIGSTPKATVHHRNTPLHLAFSCYLVAPDGSVLLTRRATTKITWPGVWTNSCCGHPAPDESIADAVTRRLRDELGVAAEAVELILPRFRYRAVMADGTVENEICPVYRATAASPAFDLNPDEVAEARWLPWPDFVALAAEDGISPWCREQVDQLRPLDPDPRRWPVADPAETPGRRG